MLLRWTLPLALAAGLWGQTDTYYFGFLKSAPGRVTLPKDEAEKLQQAHLAHLRAMGEKRALAGAGPLLNGGTLRGVIIYHTESVEKAREMAEADPVVRRGQLVVELHPWRGSETDSSPPTSRDRRSRPR